MRTRCVTCRREAAFRFCSDGCFLAWARTRVGVECAVCQYEVATGRIGNPHTSKLCEECKRAEENDGWVETWVKTTVDDELDAHPVGRTLAELTSRKGRRPSDLSGRILALCLVGKREERPYRGKRDGHRHGVRVSYRPYTNAEIAGIVGCDISTVGRALNQFLISGQRPPVSL